MVMYNAVTHCTTRSKESACTVEYMQVVSTTFANTLVCISKDEIRFRRHIQRTSRNTDRHAPLLNTRIGRGHTTKQSPTALSDLCTPLVSDVLEWNERDLKWIGWNARSQMNSSQKSWNQWKTAATSCCVCWVENRLFGNFKKFWKFWGGQLTDCPPGSGPVMKQP